MSSPLADLNLQSEAAVFVEQQRRFRESVEKMYGHKDLSGDIIAHSISGSIKLMDALALARAVKAREPKHILEVGSFLGFSTRVLMDASEPFGSSITSIDPRIRHRIFDDIKSHVIAFNPEERLRCRDAFFCHPIRDGMYHDYLNYEPRYTREQADEILGAIEVIEAPFDTFDFAFIDGDHSYVATVENLLLAAQMMEPGSLIVLHDAISWPDVLPAANDVATRIEGLDVVDVAGAAERDFYIDWWSKFPGMAENPAQLWNMAGSICDGLCIVKIAEDIDPTAFTEACRTYAQANDLTMKQVRRFQHERDTAAHQRDNVTHERNIAVHERDVAVQERDRLIAERDDMVAADAHEPPMSAAPPGPVDKLVATIARKLPRSVKDRLKDQLRRVQSS